MGSVFALDPDIPLDRQRIRVNVAGAVAGHRLLLDKHDLGVADAPHLLLPVPGIHVLTLVDAGGRVVDQVRFSVR
jgi:penicillin-binding protein 1C